MNMIRALFTLIPVLYVSQVMAFNLPKQTTKPYECKSCEQLSRDTLQEQWGIVNSSLEHVTSNRQKSFGYKKQVTAAQLEAGVTLQTTAPGAVIRIVPLQKQAVPQLQITTSKKEVLSLKAASSLYSQDGDQGNAMNITTDQTVVQIKPELGSGNFVINSTNKLNTLKAAQTDSSDAYSINVLDKSSSTFLEIETDSSHYQYGDKVTATFSFNEGSYEAKDIQAFLIDPMQKKVPLQLVKLNDQTFSASVTLESELNDHGENWYIEADVGGGLVRRTGHCAFSYSIPSAALLSIKKSPSTALTFVSTVEVASASRYALQSVLFRKNNQGEPVSLKTLQKAQWLEPGIHQIEFTFENSNQLKDEELYLGYLRLIDYGQLKSVYQFDKPIELTKLLD